MTTATVEFPALKEASGKLEAKQKELADIFAEAGPDIDLSKVKSVTGDSAAIAAHIASLNDEMTDLGKKVDELKAVARAAEASKGYEPGASGTPDEPAPRQTKSLGEQFTESPGRLTKGLEVEFAVELKTLFQTSAGFAPEATRGPRIVLDEQRPVQLVDLIPSRTTNQTAIKYMEETTFTNGAVEVAEGSPKGEAALVLTERTSDVRKIAVWIPVTDEQLEDVEGIAAYLDNRLSFMVRQRLDGQIVAGNGTAPNLSGILDQTDIQTQAKGADPTPDAVYRAMTKVRVTGQAIPDLAVFHPNDWQEVRLLRTSDGIYIWGNPSEAGPERIWGLRVVQVQAATEGTAIVGDFGNFTELAFKKGMTMKRTDSHGEYFISNKQVVLAEVRVAFTVFRPKAFCQVTGV